MILDRIQHYLSIAFFTVLIITQALVFVGVNASNEGDFLQVVFIEPLSENIDIGDSVYFQAMIADQEDKNYDLVYFNLKNLNTGLDENYQASLQDDGTWIAQNIWDTNNYSVGQYYISVVAHNYDNNSAEVIYYSQNQLINLNGSYEMAEVIYAIPLDNIYFNYPTSVNSPINPHEINNNFTTVLYIDNYLSNTVSEVEFKLFNNSAQFPFEELASNMGMVSDNLNYTSWEADIDLLNLLDGEYKVAAVVKFIDSASEEYILESDSFIINSDENSFPPDGALSITSEIIKPSTSQIFLTGDIMDVLVSVSMDVDYMNLKITHKSEDFFIIKGMSLESSLDNTYSASIDFNNDGPDGSPFILGSYLLQFEVGYRASSFGEYFPMEEVSFSLQEGNPEELLYEIILNSPLPDSRVEGGYLEIDFETSWEVHATPFSFSLIKDDNVLLGGDYIIPLVATGTVWRYGIYAEDHGFTNGTYILNAHADDPDGNTVNLGPIPFEWQITEEDEVIIPTLAMHLEDTNLGPGDILIGSGNIPGAEFILENTTDEDDRHSLGPSLVNCSASNMINSNIQELTEDLEHGDCYYYILREGDNLANYINYDVYLQKELDNGEFIYSNKQVVTYFDEDNQDFELPILPEDIILKIHQLDLSDEQDIVLALSANWDRMAITPSIGPFIFWENKDSGDTTYTGVYRLDDVAEEELVSLNISIEEIQANNTNAPFIFLYLDINSTNLPNGEYFVYGGYANNPAINGVQSENRLSITINNQNVVLDPEDGVVLEDEENQDGSDVNEIEGEVITEEVYSSSEGEEEQVEESVDLVIDYYSTCIDQGIEDQEICMQFRATMDLLNQSCIEQGIYEALACEDYLYRMEVDLECQENNIIDGEECKNYLLEKYGSQVDCQLEDMNLCNNILRNEYLSRLVVEQKLSQNINQAVFDLLGQNISIQDLSDVLEADGIVSLDVLPLVPDQGTRVLLARAQKETILEEKDKLTILNQAVIILDADGDGLSDDLELYYGTEINNSDTDGDGYSDGEEIKNGYDPLGPGSLIKERTNFDLVTLDDEKIIEQPKVKSKKIDKKMEVENIDVSEEKLSLSGKAAANTWVNLYLYSSLPLVMTTKTDASGNWSYDIKESLTDGHHRVFVTINDDTGKIVKQSRPISFLIKEAKAVTSNDYFDEGSSSTAINNLFIYYILGGAFLVFLALGAIVYLHKGKNKNLEI